jgi:trans-aconitate methyltransferase
MEEVILRRGLKMIKKIFEESTQSQDEDLFRIPDIINSLDKKQIESKKWLVDTLAEYYTGNDTFIIGGGWYGLLGYLVKLKFPDHKIVNTDIDEKAIKIAKQMFPEVKHQVIDMINENYSENWAYQHNEGVFISTSIEHIHTDDVDSIMFYNPNKMVALQSNNFYDHPTHINCSETLDDFKEYISPMLKEVYYAGELYLDDYTRFMIIGRT